MELSTEKCLNDLEEGFWNLKESKEIDELFYLNSSIVSKIRFGSNFEDIKEQILNVPLISETCSEVSDWKKNHNEK